MRKLAVVVATILAFAAYVGLGHKSESASPARIENSVSQKALTGSDGQFEAAFKNRQSNVQLEGRGKVVKLLRDDNQGTRHQKFLVRLDSGLVLLIAHNIDLAARVDPLNEGDWVRFYGEYEWSDKGGVVHWTHHDPKGHHLNGWIERAGKRFH